MKIKNIFLTLLSSLTLAACSSGGSEKSDSEASADQSTNRVAVVSDLTVTGNDAAEFNGKFSPSHYAYLKDEGGADELLIAANSAQLIQVASSFLGDEISNEVIDTSNILIMNIFPFGVSMKVQKDDLEWNYTKTCISGTAVADCEDIIFDTENRTVTFLSAELEAQTSSDESEQSTGPIFVSGTITWSAADEVSASSIANLAKEAPEEGVPATLSDLQGVWQSTDEFDEYYFVITEDEFIEYDYDGDSAGGGDNCYDEYWSSFEEVGNGEFLFDGLDEITLYISGDSLVDSIGILAERSDRLESSFVPDCE